MKKLSLEEQAKEIIRIAQESGVQSNYFFLTTFKRYQTQLSILKKLETSMEEQGVFVKKEYIKGQNS